MANSISIDVNTWPAFILRWLFAGVWATIGFALATKYLIPHLPFL